MTYTFNIVGVSPVLHFFNHQYDGMLASHPLEVEYIATDKCTLDSFIKSVEPIPIKWGWDLDEIVRTVIEFWMHNSETIGYWKLRLNDAGNQNLLVARIADIKALKTEFELLLDQN